MKRGMKDVLAIGLLLMISLFGLFGAATGDPTRLPSAAAREVLEVSSVESATETTPERSDAATILEDLGADPAATALACDDWTCSRQCWARGRCEGNCYGSICRCLGTQPVCP